MEATDDEPTRVALDCARLEGLSRDPGHVSDHSPLLRCPVGASLSGLRTRALIFQPEASRHYTL